MRPAPRKSPTGCSPVLVLVVLVVIAGVVTLLGPGSDQRSAVQDGAATSTAVAPALDAQLRSDLYEGFDPSNWMLTPGAVGPVVPSGTRNLSVLAVGRIGTSDRYHVVQAGLTDPAQVGWSAEVRSTSGRPSVGVAGDVAYVQAEGQVQALDWRSGAVRWITGADPQERIILAAEDRVLLATPTAVRALAAGDGSPIWARPVDQLDPVEVVGGRLLLRDTDPTRSDLITTIDLVTGKDLRSISPTCPGGTPAGMLGRRIIAVPDSGDVVTVPETAEGCLVRWSPSTGDVRWRARATNGFGSTSGGTSFVADATHLALSSPDAGVVRVVDLETGAQRALAPEGGERYRPAVVRDGQLYLYVVRPGQAAATVVRAIDLASGRARWSFDVPATAVLFAGDEGIRLYRVASDISVYLVAETVDPASGRRRRTSATKLADAGQPTAQVRDHRDGVATLVIGDRQVLLVPGVPEPGLFPPG